MQHKTPFFPISPIPFTNLTQINSNGQVVWVGFDGNDDEIYYYDGSTVKALTSNTYQDAVLQINSNGHMIFNGYVGGDANLSELFLAIPIDDYAYSILGSFDT